MEAPNLSKNVGRSCMVSNGRGGPWRASLLKVSKAAKRLLSQAEAESIDAAAIGSSPYFPAPGSRKLFQLPMSSAVWMSHILSEGVLAVWFSQDSFFYMCLYVFMKIVALRLTLNEPKSSPVRTTGRMGVARLATCTTTCCAKGWDTMGQRDTKTTKRLQRDQKATIALNCSGRPRRPQTTTQDLE